jgi:hypothetical protein
MAATAPIGTMVIAGDAITVAVVAPVRAGLP